MKYEMSTGAESGRERDRGGQIKRRQVGGGGTAEKEKERENEAQREGWRKKREREGHKKTERSCVSITLFLQNKMNISDFKQYNCYLLVSPLSSVKCIAWCKVHKQ